LSLFNGYQIKLKAIVTTNNKETRKLATANRSRVDPVGILTNS